MNKNKLSLFLFIDAFGWEIKQRYPDFLKNITRESKPLETILGYSSACDPSIISGRTPSEHKLWSSYYYDPEGSPFKWTAPLSLLPAFIMNHRRVRSKLTPWIQKRCGFTGYFQLYNVPFNDLPLFNYAEQKRIWEPGGLPEGASIFDRLDKEGIPFYAHNSAFPDKIRIRNLKLHVEHQSVNFAYCSLGALDALMHQKGTTHPDIDELIHQYDEQLRDLITTAQERYDEVSWYLFTDHGMHDVIGTHNLMQEINALGLKWKRDYIAFYDATMARFWFMNENARATITARLFNHPQGRILNEQELKQHGTYFPDHQYGELIFLMNSGIQIAPSHMGNKACKGMHGFNPSDPDSKAMICSNRSIPETITRIQDIYQVMEKEVEGLKG
jgi:predicted AlkP superfamily pyrophosphatase or phosphodiesterase